MLFPEVNSDEHGSLLLLSKEVLLFCLVVAYSHAQSTLYTAEHKQSSICTAGSLDQGCELMIQMFAFLLLHKCKHSYISFKIIIHQPAVSSTSQPATTTYTACSCRHPHKFISL